MTDFTTDLPHYHVVGIGAGPANLSLAALYQSAMATSESGEQIALFDRAEGPTWHPALLHSGVRMQTSWLKDLVSIIDPTHQLSFLNYLVSTGRLFAMLNSQFDVIPRREYMRYLAWSSERIDNIHYGVDIEEISLTDRGFVVRSQGRAIASSDHLVVGVGTKAMPLPGLAHLPADRSFVADEVGFRIDSMREDLDAPIAVVGSGQTGIECVMRLLNAGFRNIAWIGRRQWFQSIDDSPGANDFYRPGHQMYLQGLSRETRRRLVEEQYVTGDALTPGALRTLYQANYDKMLEVGHFPVTMYPGRDVKTGEMVGDEVVLRCQTHEAFEDFRVKYAIVSAGREAVSVPFDDDLAERVERDDNGELIIEQDYSVRWKGMDGHQLYALNRGRHSHGIPDANLTLLPMRSALVLNSMFGRQMFNITDDLCSVKWA